MLVINFDPFGATLFVDDVAAVVVNGHGQFHFEYHRSRQGAPSLASPGESNVDKHKGKKIVGYWEDGQWATSIRRNVPFRMSRSFLC
jgi:hypothetical protein